TAWWLSGFRPPLTYISFGFFQPLFLAALFAAVVVLDTLLSWRSGPVSGRDLALRGGAAGVALLAIFPFAAPLLAGLTTGMGYVVGHTSGAIQTGVGYVSYPKNWLKGIFEARPLFADGLGLPLRQLSFAFFLSPLAVLSWLWRAWRRERTGAHLALAVWGAVTLLLAISQRMNVYYAAPLAAMTPVQAAPLPAPPAPHPRWAAGR